MCDTTPKRLPKVDFAAHRFLCDAFDLCFDARCARKRDYPLSVHERRVKVEYN
jgi:hypothetical protein